MNQDKVKEILTKYLPEGMEDFQVIFTGKESSKIDGLYNKETKEILIHNRNFKDDNNLIYTALHEFAHHIDFIQNPKKSSRHCHNKDFEIILHGLVVKAMDGEDFKTLDIPEVRSVISVSKEHTKFLKNFGKILISCYEKCQQYHYPFEDVVERVCQLDKKEAKVIMSMYAFDVPEDINSDLARNIVKLKDPVERQEAIENKALPAARAPKDPVDEETFLMEEKKRVEKAIEKKLERLKQIEEDLQGFEDSRAVNDEIPN
jgi:hypothetical protein